MNISMIVAMTKNRVIGLDNQMPWHLPADLKYFKATTLGKPIIMGRKTFESIGRPLPGRQNIVITRNTGWAADGVDVADSIDVAIALAGDVEEVMITGGSQIYGQAMPRANRLFITEIDLELEGDTYFPEFDVRDWEETRREPFSAEGGKPGYAFVVYERV
ncbi:MAG: type 3 dihydrofolate reductase [Kordiimonadales bacterium]|nr:MAG: type 3 dihydrofolate reductase [Kordiimonadales bacterium]